jgi:hypothetical protein
MQGNNLLKQIKLRDTYEQIMMFSKGEKEEGKNIRELMQ